MDDSLIWIIRLNITIIVVLVTSHWRARTLWGRPLVCEACIIVTVWSLMWIPVQRQSLYLVHNEVKTITSHSLKHLKLYFVIREGTKSLKTYKTLKFFFNTSFETLIQNTINGWPILLGTPKWTIFLTLNIISLHPYIALISKATLKQTIVLNKLLGVGMIFFTISSFRRLIWRSNDHQKHFSGKVELYHEHFRLKINIRLKNNFLLILLINCMTTCLILSIWWSTIETN